MSRCAVQWWHGLALTGLLEVVVQKLRAKARSVPCRPAVAAPMGIVFFLKAPLWSLLRPCPSRGKLFRRKPRLDWVRQRALCWRQFPSLGCRLEDLALFHVAWWAGRTRHCGRLAGDARFHVVACAAMTMLMSDGLVAPMTLVVGSCSDVSEGLRVGLSLL
jgi:hypothetical protein